MLAHELCHRRAHDPFWSIVRNCCVALHWFNPLVWLGARLSRVDAEMACDDRVTAKLQDIDRLAYANSIVSASGRSGNAACVHATGTTLTGRHLRQRVTAVIRCVRGNRWAIALGSLAAAAVLLVSFATSESEPLPTVANRAGGRVDRPPPLPLRMGMRPSRAPSAFLKGAFHSRKYR